MSDFVEFRAGETIFEENEDSFEMYIIQSGSVEILKEVRGAEQLLAVLERGDFFGEMSLLEHLPRTAAARAREGCRLLKIDESVFDEMVAERPEIAARMLRQVSSRLREVYSVLRGRERGQEHGSAARPREAVASLLHPATGKMFLVPSSVESIVGRIDEVTGHVPAIDLGELDEQHTVSRWHARIRRRENRWLLAEESPSRNGTYVGGERVQVEQEVPLEDGVEIRFGDVKTVFRAS